MTSTFDIEYIESHLYPTHRKDGFFVWYPNYYPEYQFKPITSNVIRCFNLCGKAIGDKKLKKYYRLKLVLDDNTFLWWSYSKLTLQRKQRRLERELKHLSLL